MNDFKRVADLANGQILQLLESWFPSGRKDGHEYVVGSVNGEAGHSLKINLAGKVGVWMDFAEGVSGGDLISLYKEINRCSDIDALKAVAASVGYRLEDRKPSQIPQRPVSAKADKGVKPVPEQAKDDWQIVMPVPADLDHPPMAHEFRGMPELSWKYRDNDGHTLGYVMRFKRSEGGKEILPLTLWRHGVTGAVQWKWKVFPGVRPLYLPKKLRDGLDVVVVEGEKCAHQLARMVGDLFNVASFPGGSNAADKADWSPLYGRTVYLWPDCDAQKDKQGNLKPEERQPGMKCMLKIADILYSHGSTVRMVDIPFPGERPSGWDCADWIADGATADELVGFIRNARVEFRTPAGASADPDEPSVYAVLFKTGSGDKEKIKPCRENVLMILEHDADLRGCVALDEFSQLQLKRHPLPWDKRAAGEWTESNDFNLGMFIARKYGFTLSNTADIEKAVAECAFRNQFNSVTEYMDRCAEQRDGVNRIDTAFVIYWGAEDTRYIRIVSRLFFIGMAKRAYCPGCKYDWAPVFEGNQGIGKSTALQILGGEWFGDTPFKMGDKDSYLTIQGTLLYEIAELEQFNRAETTAIKAFMSSKLDRYREPYGRRIKNVPHRTVFAATTNEGQYFRDATGNRRFWPVNAKDIDADALRHDRDLLIGEAVVRMQQGELWYPTPEENAIIEPEQAARELNDPWGDIISHYLDGRSVNGEVTVGGKLDKVSTVELLTKALHIDAGRLGPARGEVIRIGICMRKLGWVRKRESSGSREWMYHRPKPDNENGGDYVPF